MVKIEWLRACPPRQRKALVLLPGPPGHPYGAVTIAYEGRDGILYGCRDVANTGAHRVTAAGVLAAWIIGADQDGLPVRDEAGVGAFLADVGDRLRHVAMLCRG